MREILFRGKRIDNGQWVEGWYEMYPFGRWPLKASIISAADAIAGCYEHIEVDPATVGQYVGLTDKNGKKIFEGDIVDIGEHHVMVNGQYLVIYSTVNHCWSLKRSEEHHHHYFTFSDLNGFAESSEVIGNIHDNPELVELEQ